MVQKASSIASKVASVPTKAPSTVATVASISITIRGELMSVVEPVAIVVRKVPIGVTMRETMCLGNTHNTQAPELIFERVRGRERSEVSHLVHIYCTHDNIF